MKLYRALKTLDRNGKIIKKGSVFPENVLTSQAVEILEAKGSIAVASDPPLDVFPTLKPKLKKLAASNVITVVDFYFTPDSELADYLKVSTSEVQSLKKGLLDILASPQTEER